MAAGRLAGELPGVKVVTDPASLPVTRAPRPLHHVVILVRRQDKSAGTRAATATALAAGAEVITVDNQDPRTDPAVITALSDARPQQVLAVGDRFGPARLLASRVAVAATGVQLPGGGQVLFPMHRLLALYGYPGSPALGAPRPAGPAREHRAHPADRSDHLTLSPLQTMSNTPAPVMISYQ